MVPTPMLSHSVKMMLLSLVHFFKHLLIIGSPTQSPQKARLKLFTLLMLSARKDIPLAVKFTHPLRHRVSMFTSILKLLSAVVLT
jgi:hypothetical protein